MTVKSLSTKEAPQFLAQMVAHAAQVMVAAGVADEALAVELGQEIALRVAQAYRGSKVRIPSGTWNRSAFFCFDLSKRDLQIYREFNGSNRAEVMKRYGISRSRLYQIVNGVRDRLKAAPPASLLRPSAARHFFPSPPTKPARAAA